ncbi:flavin reductase [Glutamicibacter arilaitensis]|uniref:flavin reductase n=1 Tax=Glutamicibacter arilaitensis TaxID=256701 RepID=UPI00384F827F
MTLENAPLLDQNIFRDVAGHFATGVTVLTSTDGTTPAGTTASAVASLSMDPPMMLICLNRSSDTHDVIAESKVFGVNILAQDQGDVAMCFARKGTNKFENTAWSNAVADVPWIDGALANIVCRVVDTAVGGTHTVFLGEVLDAKTLPGEPLTYFRGKFGRFEDDAEDNTYRALRFHVLARNTPVGEALDPQELAEELKTRPHLIRRSIVRLTAEGLVNEQPDGTSLVAPITAEMAKGFFSAQAAIESGVVDTHLAMATLEQVQSFEISFDTLDALKKASSTDLDSYLRAVKAFHRQLIGLSPSTQLLGAYGELSTAPLWISLLPEGERAQILDIENLLDLAQALVSQDVDAARTAIRRHLKVVNLIAQQVIESRGGEV